MKILFLLLIFIPGYTFSQSVDIKLHNRTLNNEEDLRKKNDEHFREYLLKLGITAFLTTASFTLDSELRSELRLTGNKKNSRVLKLGHAYGDFYYNLYFSGALILSQFFSSNKNIAVTGKALLESLIVGSLASISIKFIFGRSRPYKEEGVFKFNWFETKNNNNSLPSGHVITAFTTSTILAKSFNNFYISAILYGLAGLTAYQRIATDNHWFSDAVLGASIGYFTAEYFYDQNQIEYSKNKSYNVIPFFSKYGSGILLHYSF